MAERGGERHGGQATGGLQEPAAVEPAGTLRGEGRRHIVTLSLTLDGYPRRAG